MQKNKIIKETIENIPVIGPVIESILTKLFNLEETESARISYDLVWEERELAKELKLLLSIPIDAPKYPDRLDELLELLWKENLDIGKKAVWKNASVKLGGCLGRLKGSAQRKSDARIENSLKELKGLIER